MNSLLLYPAERSSPTRFTVTGERAASVIASHQLTVGLSLKASLLGGKRGTATVIGIDDETITLEASLTNDPPMRLNCDLIVAVPRPQTVKKVLQLAASCGVDRLIFVKSQRSEKNYLQSKSLDESAMRRELILGVQQVFDCILPTVEILRSFTELSKFDSMTGQPGATLKLVAHGASFFDNSAAIPQQPWNCQMISGSRMVLAIGPEAGWSPEELTHFYHSGFLRVSLGERMYRIEHAAALLLGQLLLSRSTVAPGLD